MKWFLAFFIFFFPQVFASAKTVEKTLAVVAGEAITLMDVNSAQKRFKNGFYRDSLLLGLFNQKNLRTKNSAMLKFLLYEKLLDQSAKKGFKKEAPPIKESFVTQSFNQKRKKKKLTKKQFQTWLKQNQFTYSTYRQFLKKALLRQAFVQKEINSKIRVSDLDLNEYAILKQKKPLFTSFEYELTYLLFPFTSAGKQSAEKIYRRIQEDSVFFDQWKPVGAKKESLKKIKLSTLHPTIKKAIQKLSPGGVSPVLSLSAGYHIFKVVWKTPIITTQNQKRKQIITNLLLKKLFNQKLKTLLKEKESQSFVQVYL